MVENRAFSAINANTISVTFEGIEEPVEIELEEALVHGENEVTFEYEGQTFTVTVNYEDPEVVEEEKAEAIKNAIDKINAIGKPATLTLEDEAKVVAARTAVNAAKELGAVDADIVNLDHLNAAETQINALKEALNEKETAIQEANVALTNLPLEVTLEDKEQVEEARELVNKALELGAEENDFVNLWKLTDAEAKIAELEEEAAEAEAVQAVIDAIDALPEEITLEDAEAVADARAAYDALTEEQQELVTNVDVLEAAEAKIAELEEEAKELKVESVSAIDTTKVVTVKATAPNAEEEATADVAIFAYDEEGVRGEDAVATAADVEIVEGAIEVEFEGLETGNYVAVVTVGEEEAELDFEIDFDAADAAVEAVNKATNQIQLAAALGNDYFAEVYDEANIVAYATLMDKDYSDATVAEVIEDIVEINEGIATAGEFEAVETALNEAYPNQLTINSVLNENFKNVDADNIEAYIAAIYGEETAGVAVVDLESMEEIQEAIDVANATAVVDALFDGDVLAEGVDQAKIDAAKTMVEALKEKEVNVTDLETKLATAQGLLDAADALEAATEAVNALFVDADAEDKELALGVDQDAIDAAKDLVKEVTEGEEKTKLNNLIQTAENLLAEFAINLYGNFTTMGASGVKGYTVGFALKGEYKMKDLTNAVMNVYKGDDLLATVTATDKFFSTEEGGLGNTKAQSAPFDVFGDFDYVEDGYWNYSGWQGELLDVPTEVEILVTYENGRTAKLTSTILIEDLWSPTGLLFNAFFVENVNRAETVEEMNAALLALVENDNNDYLNVPGADKLFVAEKVLETRNEATDKEFANYEALTGALTNALNTRTAALDGINALKADDKIADVIDVLEAVSAEFAEMTNAEKADIAEGFFLGLEFDEDGNLETTFKTLAAVKAAAGL